MEQVNQNIIFMKFFSFFSNSQKKNKKDTTFLQFPFHIRPWEQMENFLT